VRVEEVELTARFFILVSMQGGIDRERDLGVQNGEHRQYADGHCRDKRRWDDQDVGATEDVQHVCGVGASKILEQEEKGAEGNGCGHQRGKRKKELVGVNPQFDKGVGEEQYSRGHGSVYH
jgi:hypothetical protein